MNKKISTRKIVISGALIALTLAIAPFSWFSWGPTKAFPGQHLINVLAGIILGPVWAMVVAAIAGTLRITFGIGTIFAYPGGIPGGFVVGVFYLLIKKLFGREKALLISPWTEPVGTVLIGGTLSWYLFDPLMGGKMHGKFGILLPFFAGWALSSIIGAAISFLIIISLERIGFLKRLEKE